MSSKLDRALYGPSWTEVIVGAILSVIIGALIGFLMLALKPVLTVKEIPKDAPFGQIYFIDGSHVPARSADVEKKEKAFETGQTVQFSESELNFAFEGPQPQKAAAPAVAAKPGDKPAPPAQALSIGNLSFRLKDNTMQVSAMLTVSVLGFSQDVLVQSNGGFTKSGGIFVYAPDTIYVGSCSIEKIPFITGLIEKRIFTALNFPPELVAAWSKLSEVGVQGTSLKLVTQH